MKFSIIIPLAPDRQIQVLDSIGQLDYSRDDYEILVEKGTNPSINRNRGIKKAQGEILAFVDDDAQVDSDWLKKAEEFFCQHSDYDVVGGPQLTPKTDSFFAKTCGLVLSSFFGAYKMSSRYKKGPLNLQATELNLTSANFFIKRSLFDKNKLFDERLFPNEETELLQRIKKLGHKIAYHPDIIAYHHRRKTLRGFLRQIFNYGRGRARQTILTGIPWGRSVKIPLLFLLYILYLPTAYYLQFGPEFTAEGLPTTFFRLSLLPIMIYITIDIIVSFTICFNQRDFRYFLILPWLFFLNHLSYPVGFIYEYLFRKQRI